MKWIYSALASDVIEDVYFLEGTVKEEHVNGSFGSGIWLRVHKGGYIIVDMTPEYHEVIAQNVHFLD
jgi:hypothetical protein